MILIFISSLTITVNPDTATVGDSLQAIIEGETGDSIVPLIPDSFPDILVFGINKKEGRTEITFTSFSTGFQMFRARTGEDTLKASYFIRSLLGPENKGLSPIHGPYGFFNWHYLLWLLLIPVIMILYSYISSRKKRRTIEEEPEKEPGEEAMDNLEVIEENIENWNWNKIYTSLSYVVRRYIERTTGINAVEATTFELMKVFKKKKDKRFIKLVNKFPAWDLIKFADQESTEEKVREDIALFREIIRENEKERESEGEEEK